MGEHEVKLFGDHYVVMNGTKSCASFYERKKAEEWCDVLNGDKKIVDTILWDDFLDFMDGTCEEED